MKLLIIVYSSNSFFGLLTEEGGILEPSKILPWDYKKSSVIYRKLHEIMKFHRKLTAFLKLRRNYVKQLSLRMEFV